MTATMDNGRSFHLGEHLITIDGSEHRAWCPDGQQWQQTWEWSWLPGVLLDRNQAITGAMLTLEVLAGTQPTDRPRGVFLRGWADELGVDVGRVMAAVLGRPEPAPAESALPFRTIGELCDRIDGVW